MKSPLLSLWEGMSSSSSISHRKTGFSCPFLLTDGGDLCPSILFRSLLLTDGKRVRGATGAGGGNVRLNAGGLFFGAALLLKGRSAEKSSDMLLDVGGVPSGLLLLTGLLKRLRGEGGGAVRLSAGGIFLGADLFRSDLSSTEHNVLLDIGGVPGGSVDF